MTYRYSVSWESDTLPVKTVTGTLDATDLADANRRACFRAEKERGARGRFRSLVVVVEELSEVAAKSPNKTKGPRAPLVADGPSVA